MTYCSGRTLWGSGIGSPMRPTGSTLCRDDTVIIRRIVAEVDRPGRAIPASDRTLWGTGLGSQMRPTGSTFGRNDTVIIRRIVAEVDWSGRAIPGSDRLGLAWHSGPRREIIVRV